MKVENFRTNMHDLDKDEIVKINKILESDEKSFEDKIDSLNSIEEEIYLAGVDSLLNCYYSENETNTEVIKDRQIIVHKI